ncbi:MAG: Sir2 family NAD-dependent protein deacetylase [Actinobacteria bacterium]|nr:Sir2 family NAD-dependent protein deacetylase [Actinomycetota bacterium]
MTDREDLVAALLNDSTNVFVLSGAGISTESGIPDFRGPQGLFTRFPEASRMFELDAYVGDPEVRRAAWRVRSQPDMWNAEPNAGHEAVARWEGAGRAVTVATQNIDGLHIRAGSSEVLELHGTFWESQCLSCEERRPIAETLDRVRAGDEDPMCLRCGGILKSATVSFGQMLDPDVMAAAANAAVECDLALVIGSSLTVQPAASLCAVAADSAPLVIINAEATPYDDLAEVTISTPIGQTLTRITSRLGLGAAAR